MEILRKAKKRNAIDQKHHDRNEDCIRRLDMDEERISELENMTIETSKTEETKSKRIKKRRKRTISKNWEKL